MDQIGRDSTVSHWLTLAVLTSVYVVGELSHFLLGIVTRPQSQELQYGSQACLNNDQFLQSDVKCYQANNSQSCASYGYTNTSELQPCVWDYSGGGIKYQILAGPAFIAVFTVSGVLIGIISDRFNRKIVVSVCLAVLTAATILTGTATQYWHLVMLRMLIGAGESAFSPACSSMLSDIFLPSRRGLALGIFNWGIYFGYGLSYAIGNFVTQANIADMGWRFSYFTSGALGVAVLLLLLLIVREPPRGERKTELNDENVPVQVKYLDDAPSGAETSRSEDAQEKSLAHELLHGDSGLTEVFKTIMNPTFLMLAFAACIRHTAGFTWAYNTQLYFSTYYPQYNLGLWISFVSIGGGTLGVALGGFVSDRLVSKLGLKARLYVLAGSQLLATPFAIGVLTFSPPLAFYSLLGSYLFAEMWFGVLFAVLLEFIPTKIQSTTIAVFLFIMNNIGGNAPVLVTPLRSVMSYRSALYIMYPGNFLLSAVLFFLTSFFIKSHV